MTSALEAISMIVDDYDGKYAPGSEQVNHDGMQIYYYNETLVIRGSNERRDWFWNVLTVPWFLVGASGIWWTYGALVDARAVYMWCKGFGPSRIKLIVGHSRGGAVAQIVGFGLGIPVWTFATPAVCLWGTPKLEKPVTNWLIENDPIRMVYPFAKYVGDVKILPPVLNSTLAKRHSATSYKLALSKEEG